MQLQRVETPFSGSLTIDNVVFKFKSKSVVGSELPLMAIANG